MMTDMLCDFEKECKVEFHLDPENENLCSYWITHIGTDLYSKRRDVPVNQHLQVKQNLLMDLRDRVEGIRKADNKALNRFIDRMGQDKGKQ